MFRLSWLFVAALAFLASTALAWSKDDQEIFRIRDELSLSVPATESPPTFYQYLGITPSASQDDINKAYKKKSRQLHPDKVKQSILTASRSAAGSGTKAKKPSTAEIRVAQKAASEAFARLGLITQILRGPGRERYDFFLSNGFPKWKGTGYYYARFRPGLGSVLVGLFVCVGGAGHWLALYLGWKRQREFVDRYVRFARQAAWGEVGVPGLENLGATANAGNVVGGTTGGNDGDMDWMVLNRRQRRQQEKEGKKDKDKSTKRKVKSASSGTQTPTDGAVGAKKRVVAENGKILVVDSVGNVFLEQADEDGEMHEFLLDANELPRPSIRDTALYRLPLWTYNKYIAKYLPVPKSRDTPSSDIDDAPTAEGDVPDQTISPDSSSSDFEVLEKVKTTAMNGLGKASKSKKGKGGKAR